MKPLSPERYIILLACLCCLLTPRLKADNLPMLSDTIRPIITTLASDQSTSCNQTSAGVFQNWYDNAGGAMATDNSGNVTLVANLTFADALIALEASSANLCGNTTSLELTWIAIDDCNNQSLTSTTATFTTTDITSPTFINFPTFVTFNCVEGIQDSLNQWIENKGDSQVGDSCSDTLVYTHYVWTDVLGNTGSSTFDNPVPIPVITDHCNWFVNVSFFVEDDCGNSSTATGRFLIVDNLSPEFSSLPMDITISCEEINQLDSIYGIDACQGNIEATLSIVSDQGTDPALCDYYNYSMTRSWVVTDACGNSSSHMHNVLVQDLNPPTFTLVDTVFIQCEEVAFSHETFPATNISDNCMGNVTVTYTDVIIGGGCNYEIARTWLATDVCLNSFSETQFIFIEDTSAPIIDLSSQDISVSCDALSDIDVLLLDWITNQGYANATDSCSNTVNYFAAIPGSYDINDETTFPGTPISNLEAQSCPTDNGFLHSVTADFVFFDICGNASVTTATFGLIDTNDPVIENCISDLNVPMDPASCQANVTLTLPDVSDNCSESISPVVRTLTELISSSSPGDNSEVVDSVIFQIGPINLYNSPANGMVEIIIDFVNVDMDDGPGEFFIIKGEDGTILDSTDFVANQCEDLTTVITNITPAQINLWAADGYVEIRLIPNVPTGGNVLAINDVCGGSSATINLTFDIDLQATLQTSLQIDQGSVNFVDAQLFPLDTILTAGIHNVIYTFYDCAGNENSCVQQVSIEDNSAPQIQCPIDQTLSLDPDKCQREFVLSTDIDIDDNCSFSEVYNLTLPPDGTSALIEFSYNTILDTFLADNNFFSFIGVDKIEFIDEPAILEITITGDINENNEQFEIFVEGGTSLGKTNLDVLQDCGFSVTQFLIDTMTFNSKVADGKFDITALAPTNSAIPGGGINNCMSIPSGSTTDGISEIRAKLFYQDASVTYHIDGATTRSNSALIKGDSISTEILNGGINRIVYEVSDAFGNIDSCHYFITVEDTEKPEVSCQNVVVFVHPSGLIDYELSFDEIHLASSDNCGIDTFTISPNNFDCTLAGSIVGVTLEVFDEQGNSNSCVSQVRIETPVLTPSFTAGVCPGDTLQLFANVPEVTVQNAYTFSWTGPNFSSVMENPSIPNPTSDANGTYVLTTTGFNGCVSSGTVEVVLQQLTVPSLETDNSIVCLDSDVLLTATSYNGTVMYQWYEGIAPNGILLETTPSNNLLITPTTGDHYYYVIVQSPDCITQASNTLQVTVIEPPVATVQEPFITLCEGANLVLGTDVFDPVYTFHWTGPNGYDEMGAFPEVVQNVSLSDQGTYKLVIANGSCVSDTATTQVVIFNKPETPQISGESIFCEGNPILFTVNNLPNGDQYMWYLNGNGPIFNETDNNLFIPNAQSNLTGNWTVVVQEGLCHSDTSQIKEIIVDAELQIGAGNSSPVCNGDSVELTVSFIPGASYLWESPSGVEYNMQNPFVPAEEGLYSVTVSTASGCESIATTDVLVDEQPVITALSNNSTDCMDGSTPISFFPTVIPNGNFEYQWMGPGMFDPTIPNPEIQNASSIHNGEYFLIVYNGQCASEEEITVVDITDVPATPEFVVNGFYCEGDDLVITTDFVDNAIYYWDTPINITTTTEPTLIIPNINSDDNGFYQLYVEVNGCPSLPSTIQQIIISAVPAPINITVNNPICEGDTLFLEAGNSTSMNYQWEGPNGFTSTSQDTSITNITQNQSGTYRVRVIQNNCPSEWTEVDIEVTTLPIQPVIDASSYEFCLGSLHSELDVCIDDTSVEPGASYELYINGTLLNTSLTGCFQVIEEYLDINGDNEIFVISSKGNCRSFPSDTITINLISPPAIDAEATINNFLLCDENTITLEAEHGPPVINVEWATANGGADIKSPTEIETEVDNVPYGNSQIILSYSAIGCPGYSQDTVFIWNQEPPMANSDSLYLVSEATAAINLLENDEQNGTVSLSILSEPDWGSFIIENGFLTFTTDPRFSGETTIDYEICNDDCPDLCDQTRLHIFVDESVECVVPTIITPNGDNVNDALIIPCFIGNQFIENSVTIFNQWGDEVYSAKPYKNDWQGTYNGSELPVGTYFIVVNKGDDTAPINGFIMIER